MSFPIDNLANRIPFLWINPHYEGTQSSSGLGLQDMLDAEARLARFAPLLAELFDEAAERHGIIESELLEIPKLSQELLPGARILLKGDHDLPVAGSVKARGGIYNVLCFAENLALENNIMPIGGNTRLLNTEKARALFKKYTVSVGSTGNLGLSIGTIAAAMGFKARVHMSSDAKEWKKQLLRSRGAEVIEYDGDYSSAVKQGREESQLDPFAYFVDDENSRELFLGYSVAAFRLRAQLKLRGIQPDERHPLFIYLPCGVGGAPGGLCFGLNALFGKAVRCFFAEPLEAPCMTLGLITGKHDAISVYDIGLTNHTSADGLAVGRPSAFVGRAIENIVSGCFTVSDESLAAFARQAKTLEGLKIEPSAAAGFPGPAMVCESDYCSNHGIAPENVTHILWTTGGRYLPDVP
ncbi:MAG: D-serine ammonia-lyase [Lentisphaeria bacterium]|nr:D-serine ammonia-lyase [Lentisphaeria bacterium]